jgi:hypothetical protein
MDGRSAFGGVWHPNVQQAESIDAAWTGTAIMCGWVMPSETLSFTVYMLAAGGAFALHGYAGAIRDVRFRCDDKRLMA